MKTLKKVLEERPEYTKLIKAVINQIDMDQIKDINKHGIDGGYGNFIYTSDTVKFFKKHKEMIMEMAEQMADDGAIWRYNQRLAEY
jgi:hypothetical protein